MALSAKQVKALEALLCGLTIKVTAELAGVSARQISRWIDNPEFSQALKSEKEKLLSGVSSRLLALSDRAIETLADVMENPARPGQATASAAADRVLNQALRWRDLAVIEERIEALEARVGIEP